MKKVVKKPTGLKSEAQTCVHQFTQTKETGVWNVEVLPTNNRGSSKWKDVSVTVFNCSLCGEKKEYPDYWESNFVTPKLAEQAKTRVAAKTKPVKKKVKNA